MVGLTLLHAFAALMLQDGGAPAPPPKPPPAPVPCGQWGGKVHGDSRCVAVDRTTGSVTVSKVRVAEPPPSFARCGGTVTIRTVQVQLRCIESGDKMTADVRMVIVDDPQHKDRNNTEVVLDKHKGFHDFVAFSFDEDAASVAVTIDYGVWD